MFIDLKSRYVGKQFIDNTSSDLRALDAYFVNDLAFRYSLFPNFMKEISFRLQVLNILNTQYESNAWIYRYYYGGDELSLDGYFPQAGIHFMTGISLRF